MISVKKFLVTGTGASGTRWFRESLRMKGFDIADESWGMRLDDERETRLQRVDSSAGLDGMIAWTARCSYPPKYSSAGLYFGGSRDSLFRLGPTMRFTLIVHLVRHPLRTIRSLLYFSDNLRHCVRLHGSEGTYCEVDWWRQQIWDYVGVMTPTQPSNSTALSPSSWLYQRCNGDSRNPLAISAIHWLTWNAAVERVADVRIRIEDGALTHGVNSTAYSSSAPKSLCIWLIIHGFGGTSVNCEAVDTRFLNSHSSGSQLELTWMSIFDSIGPALVCNSTLKYSKVDIEDSVLFEEAITRMSARFGYTS
jgi:hypothetical protein